MVGCFLQVIFRGERSPSPRCSGDSRLHSSLSLRALVLIKEALLAMFELQKLGGGSKENHLFITFFSNSRPHNDVPRTDNIVTNTPTAEQEAISRDLQALLQDLFKLPKATGDSLLPNVQAYAFSADVLQLSLPLPDITSSNLAQESAQPESSTSPHTGPIASFEVTHNVEIIMDVFSLPPLTISAPQPFRQRPIRLALFDMDSTLITTEIIDELATLLGPEVTASISAITERAMNGELDFEASLRERVTMLKGARADTVWEDLRRTGRVQLSPGARELVTVLKRRARERGEECITGVVSGGFIEMAEWVKGELGLDICVANHVRSLVSSSHQMSFDSAALALTLALAFPASLVCFRCRIVIALGSGANPIYPVLVPYIKILISLLAIYSTDSCSINPQLEQSPATPTTPYPHLTGTLNPAYPIVTPELKRSTLISLAKSHNIAMEQTLAVGDGSNDLLMMREAGLGVAWNAKPIVQRKARARLNGGSLEEVGLLLGPD